MATSGTFNFSPNLGEIIMDAYDLIGVRRTAVLQEEMLRGRQLSNYWLSRLGNLGPNLWTVDLQSVTLIQGTPTYPVPPETVMVLDMYIETVDTGGNITDRNISPLNRSDYASLPNKLQQGQPTSFWFDRLIAPTVSFWPCPDANGPYTLKYYRYRQVQDANLAGGQGIELPYLFLDAFLAALAHLLSKAVHGAEHPRTAALKADAAEAWVIATTQNTEAAPMQIGPMLDSYYR